ncbi:lysine-sensitive aspartokinase 3 [Gallaecimonas sp. GXIMD4217]|uniref:lysine-sensitive aspartokinase 3 n=1 Tax=Gallaecimonas sp. GXIMD4217 TaxID=3131927 RepID=UPI00311AE3BB
MNTCKVLKFGGTSVADLDAMENCVRLIRAEAATRLVVVSASAGITNQLVALAERPLSPRQRHELVDEIEGRQYQLLAKLEAPWQVQDQLEALLSELTTLALAQAPMTAIRRDALLAMGERLSSLLFTALLRERGVDARLLDARSVLATDNQAGQAEPLLEQTRTQLQAALAGEPHAVLVTQGFIGRDGLGNTTTLGRGGSDYSAALFAEAMGAQELQIWTDVAGIYSTDPRLVPTARPIPELSFTQAAELATFGAKVLHPKTLWPAVRAGIPVFIGASKAPNQGGTKVLADSSNQAPFVALACRRDQTLLTLSSLSMLHSYGFLGRIFSLLAEHRISVDMVTTSEVSIALTLDAIGSEQALSEAVLARLREHCQVQVQSGLTLVTLVGSRVNQRPGVAARIFERISDFNIRLICHGASPHNLAFLVDDAVADPIMARLHQVLFDEEPPCPGNA